jgi:hypothetical protein
MKMVLQLAVQDIGQLTYLVPSLGQGHYATAETRVTPCPADLSRHIYKKYGRIVSLGS